MIQKTLYNKLCNTFMKKTWANKLRLRKLLNEEVKQKSKPSTRDSHGALVSKASSSSEKRVISFYECGKTGHIRRNCRVFLKKKKEAEAKPKAAVTEADATESCGLIATATTVWCSGAASCVDHGFWCY